MSKVILPREQIARLKLLIDLLDSRRNMFFALISAIPVSASPHCAIAIENWRQKSGPAVAHWLSAVGELNWALSSLASYSYERPNDPFPEMIDGEARFEGEGLGHPLLPDARNVRTDLFLSDSPAVLIVSGSNMSGKSTLLRTVGTNTILAQAAAPVHALRLRRLSPLQGAGGVDLDSGFTPRWSFALLRRDHSLAADREIDGRHAARTIPFGRDSSWNELA